MRASRFVLLCLLVAGCPWHGYAEVMRVHLDVLGGMADKAAGNAATGRRPASNDVTELQYPLQRARQFAYQYRADERRESYRLFVAALDRYQALVEAIDAARGDVQRWSAAQPALPALYEAWQQAAGQVRAALEQEAR